MCIKVVERYASCRCIYYSHDVDACPAYGRRGHTTKTQEVLVGYSCSKHTDASNLLTSRDYISELSETGSRRENHLKDITVEAAVDSPLRGQVLAKSQKVLDTDEYFIPASDLDEVLTSHAIERELQSLELGHLFSHVLQRARKIFAILLVIRKLDALQDLMKQDLEDELLPLQESALISLENSKLRSTFSQWDLDTRKQFFDFQWTLLAPVFSEGQHLKLGDDVRLPFIETTTIANGAFGSVHRVKIHGDHEKFEMLRSPSSQNGHMYAVKQFTRGTAGVNQRAFDRELVVLKSIRSSGHGHIIKHLATFEQQGRYSIVLPLADRNLRQFWAHEPPSSVAPHWLLQQMTGIADALSCIHNDLLAEESRPVWGYHFDLKPANILIETSSSSSGGRWLISDFGSSLLCPKELEQELPPHPGLGTYEPPECQLNLPQSRAYDLWSLGCIFLECAIWSMRGSSAIDAFAEERLNDLEVSGNQFRDDYFFTLELNESAEPVNAMTRPAVINKIRDLERDPNCSEAISELLHLIENGLLQVDQTKRLEAVVLGQKISRIRTPVDITGTSKAQVTELEN